MKGIIALDIDGTVTANAHALDSDVIDTLSSLATKGWIFIFLTGRPFQWTLHTLESLPFPYALAVQNGALLLEMPSKKILSRTYLMTTILSPMETICLEKKTDFVIYSGLENEDWCYYRPTLLPSSVLSYVLQRTAYLGEKWQSLSTFSQLPISLFPSLKLFAQEEQALMLSQSIEENLGLHAPPNRDPFNPDYFVIQATHAHATKGHVLKEFIQLIGASGPIIAAGDDYNDHSMLEVADVKIVMANAPTKLLQIADIVAPPASEKGIIRGLAAAINHVTHHGGKTSV
jgi:hydroxymethylpyrimidine pyrophosphatase-like HAD family hydrolase